MHIIYLNWTLHGCPARMDGNYMWSNCKVMSDSSFGTANTPDTPAKPTQNRPHTDKKHQIQREIGLQSVLIWFCWFGIVTWSSSKICLERSFKQECMSVLPGPESSEKSVLPAYISHQYTWFVGITSVMYRAFFGRSVTDSIPNQVRHNSELRGIGRNIPESRLMSSRHTPNLNRMQTDKHLWRVTYI